MAFRIGVVSILVLLTIASCNSESEIRAYKEVNYHQESFILFDFLKYYKEDFGRYPVNLEELTALFEDKETDYSGVNHTNIISNITDPFSGENYKYVLFNENSFIMYSVGADGLDDNSDVFSQSDKFTFNHYDINSNKGDILIYHLENGEIINDFTNIENLL